MMQLFFSTTAHSSSLFFLFQEQEVQTHHIRYQQKAQRMLFLYGKVVYSNYTELIEKLYLYLLAVARQHPKIFLLQNQCHIHNFSLALQSFVSPPLFDSWYFHKYSLTRSNWDKEHDKEHKYTQLLNVVRFQMLERYIPRLFLLFMAPLGLPR